MKYLVIAASVLALTTTVGLGQSSITVTLSGATLTSVSAGSATIPAALLLNGISNAYSTLQGVGADADDLDLSSYFAKNLNDPRWEVDFGAWVDTNGPEVDFFVFEAGGNDAVTLEAWFSDGTFGQAVAVAPSFWTPTGFFLPSGPNAGQQVYGLAFSVTDLRDAAGSLLPLVTTLKGIRVGSSSIDGCVVAAVNPGGAGNLPPVASAGLDTTLISPQSSVGLDGSASFDPDGPFGGLAFVWSQVSGPNMAMVTNATTPTATASGLVVGTYVFQVLVTDGGGATDTDLVSIFVVPAAGQGGVSGELRKWHRVSITFPNGPATSETATPNPFLDYRLDVTFTHVATQKSFVVPGFYAADGNAGVTHGTAGSVFRVHFAPDESGVWTYVASFVSGPNIAVAADASLGTPVSGIHDASGMFTVLPTNKAAPDHRGLGLLRYRERHHLVYAETGQAFLKGGADSPENFLGFFGFDGTYDTGGLLTPGLVDGLHRFAPHAMDWNPGDPNWIDDEGDEGRNMIGALNYLGSQGVNSVYFLTYNVDGGDGRDTWPWISSRPAPPTVSEKLRFDCSKLDQWEIAFSHMDALGIQLHVVTQETENDGVLDGGTLGTTRRLYYRELIARFSHHLAVFWNLGEENNNGPVQLDLFAQYIRSLDPYDHPVGVHTNFNAINATTGLGSPYTALYGNSAFEATSLQGNGSNYNGWALSIRSASAAAGRPWAVFGDEQGPRVDATLNNLTVLRTDSLFGNLMGGGSGVEWYFGYQGTFGDVQSEDWRPVEPLWQDTRRALEFLRTHTRFFEMEGRNDLVSGFDYALAKPGEQYALYVKQAAAGLQLDLESSTDTYTVRWFDPRTGNGAAGLLVGSVATVTGPSMVDVGLPPSALGQDWVCLVENENIGYLGGGVVSAEDIVSGLRLNGSPVIPNPGFAVTVSAPAGTPVVLVANLATTNLPVATGALRVLPLTLEAPFLQVVVADGTGSAMFPLPIPAFPGVNGLELFLQAGFLDPNTEAGVSLTDSVRLRLHL